MTDLQPLVVLTFNSLADLLASAPDKAWDAPSLCENWQVRHVIAHVTMPARLTPEKFATEMAAAGGDFTVLSNAVAARDASLAVADHLDALRSQLLREWQPPGGSAADALSHAVIHSHAVTIALSSIDASHPGHSQSIATPRLESAFSAGRAGRISDAEAPGLPAALEWGRRAAMHGAQPSHAHASASLSERNRSVPPLPWRLASLHTQKTE